MALSGQAQDDFGTYSLTSFADLGLAMILPMEDEETGAEPRVLGASICDPYLLLIRDDSSALIAEMSSDDELEEIEKTDGKLKSTKWVSGCLYADTTGRFGNAPEEKGQKRIFMFLLSAAGSFQVIVIHAAIREELI